MGRLTLVATMALLGACGGNSLGTWDHCDDPSAASLDTLDLVRPDHDPLEPVEDGFIAMVDDQRVETTFGGQGFEMIDVYLRMTGDVPGCVDQSSGLYTLAGDELVREASSRVAHRQADGSYRTWIIWLVLTDEIPRGEVVELRAEVAGMTVSRRIIIEPRT